MKEKADAQKPLLRGETGGGQDLEADPEELLTSCVSQTDVVMVMVTNEM